MLAIGPDELGKPIGGAIKCPQCGEQHEVVYADKVAKNPDGTERREPSKLLAFYRCGGNAYLCGINGRALAEKEE